jgi:uncharacterized protein YdcH (DUF465 family)
MLDFVVLSEELNELDQRIWGIEKTRKHLIKQLRQLKQKRLQKQQKKKQQQKQQQQPRDPDECSTHIRSRQARLRTELHGT